MTDDERRTRLAMSTRKLAERSLHEFIKQAWHILEPTQAFVDGWHLVAVCQHLEAVSRGEIPQLLINIPPGTSKSLIVCVFWPVWEWIMSPGERFMFSSYSETLALRDSIRRRDLLLSEWYQSRWPIGLKDDQNSKGRFDNLRGGWCIVGSVTGKGLGEHPTRNISDDPHNVLQAESEADRMNVTRWFEGVFCVRGAVTNAKRVMVMQRLHAADCSGLALSKGGWTHLCLPMHYDAAHKTATTRDRPTSIGFFDPRTEQGELLWPKVYTADKVANLEVNMGLYGSAGQLEQSPSPRGGGMFKREWFGSGMAMSQVKALKRVKIVRYWDKAGTAGGDGARTAGGLMLMWYDDTAALAAMRERFVILDVNAFREEAPAREDRIKQTAALDAAEWGYVETWVEQEPGSGGKESAMATVANLSGFTCMVERVTGSKEVRAAPFATQASVKKVSYLINESWNRQFLDELEMFPVGKLKDIVDCLSGAFNKLATPSGAIGIADTFAGHTAAANGAVVAQGGTPTFFQRSPGWFLSKDQM